MKNTRAQVTSIRYCRCGWTGREQKLAVWIRDNHIISRICPRCGSTAIRREPTTYRPPENSLLH